MIKRKIFCTLIIISSILSLITCNANNNDRGKQKEEQANKKYAEKQAAFSRLKARADSAKAYCKSKGFSQQYCILIDFSIHSGKERFFVWDFAKDTIKIASLCCHGYGLESTQKKPVFSNVSGSYCSSLGKYKMGIRSYSNWGINVHYKMHGLDKTNSNAFSRLIVLHSHSPMPAREIYPEHLPLGWSQGCPVVDNETMRKIDTLMKEIKKPVLMWIYA